MIRTARMTRLLLVLAAAALLLLPGAASAAACSPLNCAPSQFTFDGGSLIGYRASVGSPVSVADLRTGALMFTLPAGLVFGGVLVHQEGNRIEWYDATTGRKTGENPLPWKVRMVGASEDGKRAVVFRSKRSLAIVTPGGTRVVALTKGNWDFDALRGNDLYLIRYLATGGYQVRLLDLGHPSSGTRVIKDPHESGTIWGSPFSRLASLDGRYLFTLYIASNGAALIHELDLTTRKARCIDLPGSGDYNSATSWALALAPNGRTLWAAGAGYGRVVAIDVRTRKVTQAFRLNLPYWAVTATQAALSPGSTKLALANGEEVAQVDLATRTVLERQKSKATAVGYAPTGELLTLL
jgi:DNA-binding beta-propeller fold protein YncE